MSFLCCTFHLKRGKQLYSQVPNQHTGRPTVIFFSVDILLVWAYYKRYVYMFIDFFHRLIDVTRLQLNQCCFNVQAAL